MCIFSISGILTGGFGAQKKDHVYKRPTQSANSIFQKTFENFSHGVFGLVGSNL